MTNRYSNIIIMKTTLTLLVALTAFAASAQTIRIADNNTMRLQAQTYIPHCKQLLMQPWPMILSI